jgi:hypothetical protein
MVWDFGKVKSLLEGKADLARMGIRQGVGNDGAGRINGKEGKSEVGKEASNCWLAQRIVRESGGFKRNANILTIA